MRRILTVGGLFAAVALAVASAGFGSIFAKTYKLPKTSPLMKAGCSVCHKTKRGGLLNAYGKDIQKVMRATKTKKLTPDVLRKVEKLDSTATGATNLSKILAGKNPGID